MKRVRSADCHSDLAPVFDRDPEADAHAREDRERRLEQQQERVEIDRQAVLARLERRKEVVLVELPHHEIAVMGDRVLFRVAEPVVPRARQENRRVGEDEDTREGAVNVATLVRKPLPVYPTLTLPYFRGGDGTDLSAVGYPAAGIRY